MEINNTGTPIPHPSVIHKPSTGPVNTEITVFFVLTGILVGLLMFVIFLCVCKFCIKSNKPLKRQQVVFTKYSSEKDFTWNGNEKRCTKYRSMEPRWSPASSIIPIDFETGSPESSLERKPDEKSVESTTSRSNFLLPGDRVLPQCSIDITPSEQSADSKQLPTQSTLAPRISEEVRMHHSARRFPRSPPVQRQTSIYVTTSDEHLDKVHHQSHNRATTSENPKMSNSRSTEIEETNDSHRKRSSISMVALASPEEMSSLEEALPAVTTILLMPPPSQTVVSAEVHQAPLLSNNSTRQSPIFTHQQLLQSLPLPPPTFSTHSHSTGSLSASARVANEASGHKKRPPSASFVDLRTKTDCCETVGVRPSISVEDEQLVLMMESRCRQNNRWLLNNRNTWSRQLYEEEEEDGGSEDHRCKVRYNDTGSVEEITSTSDYDQPQQPTTSDISKDATDVEMEMEPEVIIDLENDDDDDKLEDEPLSIESRKLWALRATFEEEEQVEQVAETIVVPIFAKTEDAPPPPPLQPPKITTTTLESSTQTNSQDASDTLNLEEPDAGEGSECCAGGPNSSGCHLPLPSTTSETRRQSYQNLLGTRKCRQKLESKGSSEKDNSFDSIETEGSSTDASRLDVVTTSMESTTDNTDSTGEGQIHRLQQMKADSGYKSLETNNGSLGSKMALGKRQQLQMNATSDMVDIADDGGYCIEMKTMLTEHQPMESMTITSCEVNNNIKTASKKRREYTRERQVVETSFGWLPEQEEGLVSGKEVPGNALSPTPTSPLVMEEGHEKASVSLRFFRSGRERSYRPFSRDYSIDEKSDALYQEFSRRDPVLDPNRCRSPRMRSRHRIYQQQQQRHSPSTVAGSTTVIDNGGCNEGESHHHRHHHHHHHHHKVSPEDSIEEEDNQPQCGHHSLHCGDDQVEPNNEDEPVSTSPHIPVIKVAPENSF